MNLKNTKRFLNGLKNICSVNTDHMVILNLLIARLFSFLWFVIRRGLFHGFLQFVFEVYSLTFGGHLLPVHKSEHGVQIGIRRLMRLFGCLLS